MEIRSYAEAATLFAKSLPERLSSYLICLGNLMVTYNRKALFAQARTLKRRMDA